MAMTAEWEVNAGLRSDERRVTGVDVPTIDARADVRASAGECLAKLGSVLLSGVINPIEGLCSWASKYPASPSDMMGDTSVCTGVPFTPACGVSNNEEIPGDFRRLLNACG
jgi:hypothetical protein